MTMHTQSPKGRLPGNLVIGVGVGLWLGVMVALFGQWLMSWW